MDPHLFASLPTLPPFLPACSRPYSPTTSLPTFPHASACSSPHVFPRAPTPSPRTLPRPPACRTVVGNANISATTALQAIDPMGREIALRRGSNVLMPILTPTKYREHYQLYEGKPCITDTAEECRRCLNARITMIGKRVTDSVWGDPPNFLKPIVGVPVAGGGAAAVAAAPADVAPRSLHTLACPVALTSRNKPATGARPLQGSAGLPLLHTTSRVHTRRCGGLLGGSKAMRAFWSSAPPSAPASAPAAVQPLQPSTDRGSDVQRINIGVFGVMNAGKSTAINAITRQDTSIVDATPGTTADVNVECGVGGAVDADVQALRERLLSGSDQDVLFCGTGTELVASPFGRKAGVIVMATVWAHQPGHTLTLDPEP
eukprot:360689-Chlamydomonas_euryale.AAC.2